MAFPKTTWTHADVASSDLVPLFRSCDAVVHLAWRIQPSRNLELLENVNVTGSRRVFEAVEEAEVPALVYASSGGAYSEGPKDRAVDESWPTDGVARAITDGRRRRWSASSTPSRHERPKSGSCASGRV